VDAVYLDLHGAMVTEHLDDGEGDLLRRVRDLVGARVPVVVSLDYHANITEAMVEHADALIGYRTYPHIDMAETGARAAAFLGRVLDHGGKPAKSFAKLGFLIPLTAQCTMIEPSIKLFRRLAAAETASGACFTFSGGFPAADIAECGPSVIGYGFDDRLKPAFTGLAGEIGDAEAEFVADFLSPKEGVARAIARSRAGGPPIVLADTQDNPGGGGNGDTVGILDELLGQRAQGAVVGLLIDPPSAARAHQAGQGAELDFALGAISGLPGHAPCRGRFKVERLGDGNFTGSGPFYRGSKMRLGPMAALKRDGVTVVLASKKVQAADQAMFQCLGIEPRHQSILVLKSSVHFRADFQPIAAEVLVVAAPGPVPADPATLPWTKLRPGVRLRPKGPVFSGRA
jgi:microcystin degradation protein MlrC